MDTEADFERQVQAEISRQLGDPARRARRTAIRSARVLAGLALVAASYWVAEPISEITTKPIATLSLADLAGLVVRSLVALWLLAGGWWSAFGEGPSREELRASAIEAVRERQLFVANLAARSSEAQAAQASADAETQSRRSKAPLAGRECARCGAIYVSAQYCPKCRIRLAS